MIKVRGILRHCFHGEYSSQIVLHTRKDLINKVCIYLGGKWKNINDEIILGRFNSEELDEIKSQFKKLNQKIYECGYDHCKDQCKSADIDSISHSIDYGPQFSIEIPL